ncbi:MAG: hypothetical protein A4E30_01574 [Methanomassiliicoccales archaeon PtaB.Bin215]|nr:MAG: hypothetical protein A4E30_01574 [Methanomassiliicoccales archaeon PtaB.Bin215]
MPASSIPGVPTYAEPFHVRKVAFVLYDMTMASLSLNAGSYSYGTFTRPSPGAFSKEGAQEMVTSKVKLCVVYRSPPMLCRVMFR